MIHRTPSPLKTNPRNCVFVAMPFTGKSYEEVVSERTHLRSLAEQHNLELVEQFIDVEEKDPYEAHAYSPLFIVNKDLHLLRQAHIVIADLRSSSFGRDGEIAAAKQQFDQRIIGIVNDQYQADHPWIRFYCDYVVMSVEDAFAQAQRLSQFSLPTSISNYAREEKDATDQEIAHALESSSALTCFEDLAPTELKRRWRDLFQDEYKDVVHASFTPQPVTIRVNPLKSSPEAFLKIAQTYHWNWDGNENIPHLLSDHVFRLPHSVLASIWDTPEYKDGLFYVQDLASMLPVIALDPKPGMHVLDIAAAPGSKTTQLAEAINDTGSIVANDWSQERLEILERAVQRHELTSITPHCADGRTLGDTHAEQFDAVLVDGTCSSEGILRYKAHKLFEWHLPFMRDTAEQQRELLLSGYHALNTGGALVYSTCTFGMEENELVVQSLLEATNADIEPVTFSGVHVRPGLTSTPTKTLSNDLAHAVRIYPHDNDTIGFFLVKIRKPA